MTQLSPKAQAVLDAYENTIGYRQGFAAAIRAAVMKCSYQDSYYGLCVIPSELLAIADELEAL